MKDSVVLLNVDRDAEQSSNGNPTHDGVGGLLSCKRFIKRDGGGDGVGESRSVGQGRQGVMGRKKRARMGAGGHGGERSTTNSWV